MGTADAAEPPFGEVMSNRERWIIYPLLIWSLAMGFRSQYEAMFGRDPFICQELQIQDSNATTRLVLRADAAIGGVVLFVKPDGKTTSVLEEKAAAEVEKLATEQNTVPNAPANKD
jgi:hypothetical protein